MNWQSRNTFICITTWKIASVLHLEIVQRCLFSIDYDVWTDLPVFGTTLAHIRVAPRL
jgi:hypothetical protein